MNDSAAADKAEVVAATAGRRPRRRPTRPVAFAQEMTGRARDWQFHAFGNVAPRLITNPRADKHRPDAVKHDASRPNGTWRASSNSSRQLLAEMLRDDARRKPPTG